MMLPFWRSAWLLALVVCLYVQCRPSDGQTKLKQAPASASNDLAPAISPSATPACDSLKAFQTLRVGQHEVDIALPEVPIKGSILVLQGFAFPKDDWCKKSSLCRKALAEGYVLIMPEMGKSTYAAKLYPETRADWRHFPLRPWLSDTLFTYLQEKYCLLRPEQNNYVLGLSTGGRGVALLVLDHPNLFKACAALSGDFDQTLIPQDRVIIGYYGSYQRFPERWKQEDNVLTRIKEWRTPIYLGHGMKDTVTPPSQTRLLYDSLRKHHPQLKVVLNMPPQHAHDYRYWDSEVETMLRFFKETSS